MECFATTYGFGPFNAGGDEFQWNLHQSGKFSVDSLYKASFQSDMPVDNNKKLEDEDSTKY
jgi:hypothetical protein